MAQRNGEKKRNGLLDSGRVRVWTPTLGYCPRKKKKNHLNIRGGHGRGLERRHSEK